MIEGKEIEKNRWNQRTYKAQGWVGAIYSIGGTFNLGLLSSSIRNCCVFVALSSQYTLWNICVICFSIIPKYSITLLIVICSLSPNNRKIGELSQRIALNRESIPFNSFSRTSSHWNILKTKKLITKFELIC